MLFTVATLVLGGWAITASVRNGVSSDQRDTRFRTDRDAFSQSILLLRQASDLSQPPVGETSFKMSPDQEQKYFDLFNRGLAASDRVGDSFLESLHPELRAMYRDELVAGTRLYLDGLKNSDLRRQLEGDRKMVRWIGFWEKHNREIVEKAFPE